jgi:Arc/MetJ-type ribon-helix-helix transcriptional regulator
MLKKKPKKIVKTLISVRVDTETLNSVKELIKSVDNYTLSDFINQAIKELLEKESK